MAGGGAVIGLLLGLGVALIWWSCWEVAPRPRRRGGPGDRIRDRLIQAGVQSVGPRALIATCAGLGALTFLVVLGICEVPAIALAFGLMTAAAPWGLIGVRARQRQVRLRDLWPDVVDNLTSAVRAGLSLPEALAQLGERGPDVLRPAFTTFARNYRASGRLGECLDALKANLADPVADRIIEALRITREVGGSDLGRLLRALSTFLRDDARTRSELEARQSWTVNAARLAVAAPWIVLGLLATRPDAVAPYREPAGVLVLAIGALTTVIAYLIMIRIGRLPQEERVLR